MNQILFFYAIGLLMFFVGLEEKGKTMPNNIIYMSLSFFVNLMAYYISYSDANYTSAAYFPLVLLIITALMLIYMGFNYIKKATSDDSKDTEDKED